MDGWPHLERREREVEAPQRDKDGEVEPLGGSTAAQLATAKPAANTKVVVHQGRGEYSEGKMTRTLAAATYRR